MENGLYHKSPFKKGRFLRALLMSNAALLLFFVSALQLQANGIAQTITIREKDAPLDKVFKAIEKQSGYYFVYNAAQIKQARPVTIDVAHATLEQTLSICFKDQTLSYAIMDKLIIVKPKEKQHLSEPNISGSNELGDPVLDVRGRVTNDKGEPVSGVTVTVKGQKKMTFTDPDGQFYFAKVEINAVLIFSGANVETTSFPFSGQHQLVIKLNTKTSKLDEVEVVAYGTTTQRFTTGNISKVSGDEIRTQPVINPMQALEGRVTGLFITMFSGIPGAAAKVRVQGRNSILTSNNPLYVVDGVPYPSQMLSTVIGGVLGRDIDNNQVYSIGGNGSPLTYINSADIESVEVLKDADATSIYGSRAANGAILITTRKGKSGQMRVDADFQQGASVRTRAMKVLNTQQYLAMRKEAMKNDNITISPTDGNYDVNGLWDTTRYTDWVKTLTGNNAKYMTANLSVSGGTANVQYLVTGTYNRQTTPFSGNFSDQRTSLHFNVNASSQNQKLHLQLGGSYLADNNQLPLADPSAVAYELAPNAPPLYNRDGTLNWAPNLAGTSSTWTNPLAALDNRYQNKTDNIVNNLQMSYRIIPELTLIANAGYNKLDTREVLATVSTSIAPESRLTTSRSAQYSYSTLRTFQVEPQINFRRMIMRGKLDVLMGFTVQQTIGSGQSYNGSGFISDKLVKDIRSATTVSVGATTESCYKYNAGFGRVGYNWGDKYIINMSLRRDGSSRFGPENRFHNFWSIGGAWILSEESFFKNNIIQFVKIKASYGTTGSDQIGDYQYMDLYAANTPAVPYQGVGGSLGVTSIPNPYLQWEETSKASIGVDVGLPNDRILLSVQYGRNRTSNQLVSYSIPFLAGFPSVAANLPATVENTSLEVALSSINIKTKKFSWGTRFNFTIPRNRLVSFPNLPTSTYRFYLSIDQPISIAKASHFLGVDPLTGTYFFSDRYGGVTFSPSPFDNTSIINLLPDIYGGLSNNITYGPFSVVFFLQFAKQIGTSSRFGIAAVSPGTARYNQPVSVLSDHWRKPGDIEKIQKYSANTSNLLAAQSDAQYIDASFVRLNNVSISYDFPEKWVHRIRGRNMRVFVNIQNLYTWTAYSRGDPETQTSGLSTLNTFVMGINAGF